MEQLGYQACIYHVDHCLNITLTGGEKKCHVGTVSQQSLVEVCNSVFPNLILKLQVIFFWIFYVLF